MRIALTAITDELRRRKAAGEVSVSVSEESVASLADALKRRRATGSPSTAPGTGRPPAARPAAASAPPAVAPVPAAPPSTPAAKAASVVLPNGDKATRWNALLALVRADSECLSHVRPGKQLVLGVGNLDARILFVGEAPGADEEIQGEPFVGPAGKLLDKMIAAMGITRSDVYIGNIMNWRPEMPVDAKGVQYGNRPPTAAEMAYCLPYLKAQIEIVNPEMLVALGATAAQGLLGAGTFKALGEIRGQWRHFSGKPLMVTYHPSYILRNPVNRSKRLIWEDFLKVMARAGLPISEKQKGYFLDK